MKKSILSLMVLALTGLAFTGCDDVPMPYNQPDVTTCIPSEVTPQGTGTAADPYNVAAALQVVNALGADETTENAIYVKGKVTGTPTIETEKYGNANYYITDDGSNKIYIFQSYYLGNRKFTADDKLNEGDEVIVCGKFTNYKGNTPETVGKGSSYIYSLNGKTEGGGDTPAPGEAKGDGTQANPYNAAGANKAASALTADGKQENVYVTGIISKIKSIDTGSFGNAEYYISEDGTTNGDQFYVYRGYYTNGDKFTSADQLKEGQKVTVLGTLVNYMGNTPEMAPGSKIVSIDGSGSTPDTPDTPGTNEGVTISGTTVTLTNSGLTAGTTTATVDLSTLGYDNAAEVTTVQLSDGATVTFAANGEQNGPKYYNATKGVRVYKNNTITIDGKANIATIVFECDSYNGTDYVGNTTATVTFSGSKAVYTNVFTGDTGGGTQLRVKKITVTYAK
jgi:hypothetical protein